MFKPFLTLFAICFFLSSSSMAAANITPYYSADYIDPTLIDPPFDENSKEFKNEIEEILKFQRDLNPKELAAARREKDLTVEMIAKVEYPNLTREKYPHLYHLLDRSKDTARMAVWKSKDYWNRKRPYDVDKRVKILISKSKSTAYPSGHTTKSYVVAHVLGLLLPEHQNRFKARAASVAQHRVIVGSHFPRDLKGGVQLASMVVGYLIRNEDFQKDFDLAKEELEHKPLR